MASASLLLAGAAQAQAPPAPVNLDEFFQDAHIQSGAGGTGCMIGVDIASCKDIPNAAKTAPKVTFTDFVTRGGNGSGGGAGLGGVFFVNSGASLTLSNVQFTGNVVKGGEGGGAPDVRLLGATIALVERESNVGALTSFNITPEFVESAGNLTVKNLKLADSNSLLKAGQTVSIEGIDGVAKIQAIDTTTGVVTLDKALTVKSSAVRTLADNDPAVAEIRVSNENNVAVIRGAALTKLGSSGSFAPGSTVIGTGIAAGTVVRDVVRDANNVITSVVLSKDVTLAGGATELNPTELKFVNTPSMNNTQFTVVGTTNNQTTLNMPVSTLGITVGMELTGTGIPAGTKVAAITGDNVTLSTALPDTVLGFTTKGIIGTAGQNIIRLAAPDSRIQAGAAITGEGIPAGTIISAYNASTGEITLSKNLTAVPDSIVASAVRSQGANTLTLASVKGLKAGMVLTGDGIAEGTTISAINGNTITVSQALTGSVPGFVASSPLNIGGSLNNLAVPGSNVTRGVNGTSGRDANSVLPYLTDGEGLDGEAGQSANLNGNMTPVNAPGGNGGSGGAGSGGVPFNYTLLKDTKKAAGELIEKASEAAAAFANAPFPSFASGAALITATVAKGITLAASIAETVEWARGLADGSRARGGAGGDGGNGGDGSEFFGGGAGGSGGSGGPGGLSRTQGGDGGAGGGGGSGGFGAGGGSGGAGGAGGPTGFSVAGDAGEGGGAGFGAGVGTSGDGSGGGGGSGYGGAIFVRGDGSTGGSLTITGNALFRNNVALAGSSTNGGEAGQSAGADLFVMKGGQVTLRPGAGKTIRFEGSIADDSAASIDGASYASGNGADIRIEGGGLVQFAGENTYTGKTIIAGGTLEATLGQGIHKDSSIVFAGAGTIGNQTLNPHLSAGALLLSEDVTRRVGTAVPGQISWDGAGGFAAGTPQGIRLNFGQTSNNPGAGQTLVWGSSALTTNSTLVFGSEYGLGSVEWMNAVNLNGQTGNVVVFDSQQLVDDPQSPSQKMKVQDAAYMRGNLTNGALQVGDTGYDGTLYLTGQNALTGVTVKQGTVATGDGQTVGRLFNVAAPGSVVVEDGGTLLLHGSETLSTMRVDTGGALATLDPSSTLTATAAINNSGALYLGSKLAAAAITNTSTGILSNLGTVNATMVVNDAKGQWFQGSMPSKDGAIVNHDADITASTSVVNNGLWKVVGTQKITTPSFSGSGEVQLENLSINGSEVKASLSLEQSGASTFAGRFTGGGALTKTGAGDLTLTGANTFTGGLTVSTGTIDTTGGGTLADTGAITVAKDAAFIAGTADTVGAVSNSGTYTANATQTVASLSNTATGTAKLNADLSSTSTLSNAAGGVIHQAADITATGTVTNHGTLNVSGERTVTTAGLAGAASGRINLTTANDKLTLIQSGSSTYAGQINGLGLLTKTGAGDLTLTGANTFTGGLTVSAGTIDTTGGGTLADTGAITVAKDAAFIAGTADTVGAVNNSGTYTANAAQTVASLSNTATGTANLNAKLSSTSTLSNAAGGVIHQAADITATGTVTNHGTLNVSGSHTTASGGYTGSGETQLAENAALTVQQSANSTYTGIFTGLGALFKTGTGTLNLQGANTFTGGLTVSAGTVETSGSGTLADTGAITVAKDAAFIAGTADTVGAVSNSGTYTANAAQTVASLSNTATGTAKLNADLSSTSTLSNAAGGVIHQAADITATGTVTNHGTLNVSGERTVTTAGLAGAASGRINLTTANDKLTLIQSGASNYAGSIKGEGALTKEGTGTLTLSSTTAGAVDIGGELVINNGVVALDGAGILAERMKVAINKANDKIGTLQLVKGDQRITDLRGEGNLALGNNRLTVIGDSQFTGAVTGSGMLDVRSGAFTIQNTVKSEDPTSVFSIGGAATNAVTSVTQQSSLEFPKVDLLERSTLDVQGSVVANDINLTTRSMLEVRQGGRVAAQNVNVTGTGELTRLTVTGTVAAQQVNVQTDATTRANAAMLHLGNTNGSVGGQINANTTTVSGGMISGVGSITGTTLLNSHSWLAPGNSPGISGFGNLSLNSGSTTEIEIAPRPGSGPRVAGVDYDQVQVSEQLSLSGNSNLTLQQWSNGTVAAGEVIPVFAVGAGKVSGQFGSVVNAGIGNVALNLGTGSLVGLGSQTAAEFVNTVAQHANQKAMLSALNVSSAGGVAQFYGGRLMERLAVAQATGGNTDLIFSRSSPEVYGAWMDLGRDAMVHGVPSIVDDLNRGQVGASVGLIGSQRSTGTEAGFTSYRARTSGLQVGYAGIADGTNWRVHLATENTDIHSSTVRGSGNGVTMGLSLARPTGWSEGLYATGRLTFSNHTNDMDRTTNAGLSVARNVSSSGSLLGVGLGHITSWGAHRLQTEGSIMAYSTDLESLKESNASSAYDAMTVRSQSRSGTALQLGASLMGTFNAQTDYSFGAKLVTFGGSRRHDVTGQLNTENTPFKVQAQGFDKTQLSLNAGVSHKLSKQDSVGATVSVSGSSNRLARIQYTRSF